MQHPLLRPLVLGLGLVSLACAQTPPASAPQPVPAPTPLASAGSAASAPSPASFTPAMRQRCETELPPAHLRVLVLPMTYQLSQDRTFGELTAEGHHPDRHERTVGMTIGRSSTQVSYDLHSLRWPDGRTCSRARYLLTVSASPQTVYIPAGLGRQTCAFREILAHELRHVQLNDDNVRLASEQLRDEALAQLGQEVHYGSEAELDERIALRVRQEWIPSLQAKLQALSAAHRQIDSPEEYQRAMTLCGGEVARLLGPAPTRR